MSEFSLTFPEVIRKAENLKEENQHFFRLIRQLTETEEQLNRMWEGETRAVFHRSFLHDAADMHLFYRTVDTYVNTLEQITTRYAAAEQRAAEIAGRSRV